MGLWFERLSIGSRGLALTGAAVERKRSGVSSLQSWLHPQRAQSCLWDVNSLAGINDAFCDHSAPWRLGGGFSISHWFFSETVGQPTDLFFAFRYSGFRQH